jgi:hypothetical protein
MNKQVSSMRVRGIVLIWILLTFSVGIIQSTSHILSANQAHDSSESISEAKINNQVEEVLSTQFFENLGQVGNEDILFYGRIPGAWIGFGEKGILLLDRDWQNEVWLLFENANSVAPTGLKMSSQCTNYFLNGEAYTQVRGFRKVIYENLWRGIDLVYSATTKGAKYEFHVSCGADPNDIIIQSRGHDSITIQETTLAIKRNNLEFIDEGLFTFQGKTEVNSRFTRLSYQSFGFEVGSYNESEELVIDPLLYSTFIGGSGSDRGKSIALDTSGNTYVVGNTEYWDFPTVNAYDSTFNGTGDCFVLKISSNGSSLLYSTFIGGQDFDYAEAIAVDVFGNAYITGSTESPDFPTVNAYCSTHEGNKDCFVLKLSADGSSLLSSTFIGGSGLDRGNEIILDTSGNAYVTGSTESPDFPTVNAYCSTHEGDKDCFVLKLSADGSSLLSSTFVGGSGRDIGGSIALDTSGNTYVTGYTESDDFPTVNAYDSNYHHSMILDRPGDCFVFKLSANGLTLLYSTFIGGWSIDAGYSIAVDSSCNVYVAGKTDSSDFPAVNAYDSNRESLDGFVLKLSANGLTLLYSTFIGGQDYDYAHSVTVDASGNAYVTGGTESSDFPAVNEYNSTHVGNDDCFVMKLSADGSTLLYSTFIGGSDSDWGESIAIDADANVYVAGTTKSKDFPTANCYNGTFGGDEDCFILKFHPTDQPPHTTLQRLVQSIAITTLVIAFFIGASYVILRRKSKSE